MDKHPSHIIIDTLGRDAICETLGVSYHSLRKAKLERSFPASWYDVISKMCIEAGIPCPRGVFNWRPAQDSGGVGVGAG